MGGQIPSTSERYRENHGAFHILHCTLSVITTKPLPSLKAWRNWLTLFARHEIVSTACPCLLVSPPPNFSNILCSSSTFYISASKCFWFRSKTFLLVGKQMLVPGETGKQSDKAPNSDFGQTVPASFVRPLASVMTVFFTSLIWYSQKPGLRTGPNISSFPTSNKPTHELPRSNLSADQLTLDHKNQNKPDSSLRGLESKGQRNS